MILPDIILPNMILSNIILFNIILFNIILHGCSRLCRTSRLEIPQALDQGGQFSPQ